MNGVVKAYIYFKEKVDYFLGGIMGFGTGAIKSELLKYLEHLLEEDSIFKLLDACFTTLVTTILGAVALHLLHKYIFKKGEK